VTSAGEDYVYVPVGSSATAEYGDAVLDGSAGNDTLTATGTLNAHQILIGGPGDTLHAANFGQDTFVFAGNFGHDTITTFHPSLDIVQLQRSQFANLATVGEHLHQVGASSVLTLDAHDSITFTDTLRASLTASDFRLV
jgi:hypothetical protein